MIIGENWHDSMQWLSGDQFDTVMNYPVTYLMTCFFARDEMSSILFVKRLAAHLMKYSDQINKGLFNLLDSHDTERFLFLCNEEIWRLKNAAAFLMAYEGIPCTYYGTEIGLTGGYDPGCRRGFTWEKNNWKMDMNDYYKKIVAIRKETEALKVGRISFIPHKKLIIMKRETQEEQICIVINNSTEEEKLQGGNWQDTYMDLITEKVYETLVIKPMSAYYLKKIIK